MTTLAIQENRITQAAQTFFVEAGDAFRLIRDQRLYKESYSDFNEYCQERWGYTRRRVDQICQSAETWHSLDTNGLVNILPNTERQVAQLQRLDPDQRIAAWSEAVDGSEAGQPTVTEIQHAVQRVQLRAQWPAGSTAVVEAGDHQGKMVTVVKAENAGAVIQATLSDGETTYPFLAGELTIVELAEPPEPTPKKPTLSQQNQALRSLLLRVLTDAVLPPELTTEIKGVLA